MSYLRKIINQHKKRLAIAAPCYLIVALFSLYFIYQTVPADNSILSRALAGIAFATLFGGYIPVQLIVGPFGDGSYSLRDNKMGIKRLNESKG